MKKIIWALSIMALLAVGGCLEKKANQDKKKDTISVEGTNDRTLPFEQNISFSIKKTMKSGGLGGMKVTSERNDIVQTYFKNGDFKMIMKRYDESGKLMDIAASDGKNLKIFDGSKKLLQTMKISDESWNVGTTSKLKNKKSIFSMKISMADLKSYAKLANMDIQQDSQGSKMYLLKANTDNRKREILYDADNQVTKADHTVERVKENVFRETNTVYEYQEIGGEKYFKSISTFMELRNTEESTMNSDKEDKEAIAKALGIEDMSKITYVETKENERSYSGISAVPLGVTQTIVTEEYNNVKVNQNIDEKIFSDLGV